ncbi:hypothetical protein HQ325_16210 [Rhodococcus sp. BP-349]|uniref:hypothetical protein n=1 Tax=unclassified Rhodococcus (in: high G+C Gram-positive bacteria) TaxID=192944 RepID=UPI001C9A646D|nr:MULTISPECIES: hypothetical protein [unclassified Rhodococcus (in: high G+C Gram-positive bacteria)]MBY6540222.1 hypothetical protein [Rhodococcus sp. BP-363]MBY6543450.1 hypothetical protein [Rhodococcus sp. BP-369]MBY6562680.1 hypothetical protein [Rhodococcus sp. BP-370]MBY6576972.1 hypothetical protein [Rhodococcus sp. BP-364]MBY6586273.1 hypothetical protein [Rhodococcus sp. BP-358]
MRTFRRPRRTVAALAIACAGALALPAGASADPAPAPDPLQQALSALESSAAPGDVALEAARAVLGAAPMLDVAEPVGTDPLALVDAANGLLGEFGLTPFFYPTAAINCSALPGAPLGIVPAVAGSAPAPYVPKIPGISLPTLPGATIGDAGETLYAFVPAPGGIVNDGANKSGMQVAWFNVNTLKGGFADMGGLTDVIGAEIIDKLPEPARSVGRALLNDNLSKFPNAGVRLAPVATGSGTVLSAIFGQVSHDGKTCAFFPTVGLTQVP